MDLGIPAQKTSSTNETRVEADDVYIDVHEEAEIPQFREVIGVL
jgi:hypothetical protein